MILYINTTLNNLVKIGLKDKDKFIAKRKFFSRRTQAETLLPGIAKLLKANKLKLSDLKGMEVVNQGGSFTSLRLGVVTANALGYGLGIPVSESQKSKSMADQPRAEKVKSQKFSVVEPEYSSEPEITVKNKKFRQLWKRC